VAAVAVGLALLAGGPVAVVAAAVVAAAVLAGVFGRTGGRWWYELLGARAALRRRRRALRRAAGAPAGPWLFTPELRVYDYQDRTGQLGVGRDAGGWFAAVAVGDDDLLGGAAQVVPAERLLPMLSEGTARPSGLQLVTLRVPAPTALVAPGSPCLESFAELAGRLPDRRPAPAAELTWVAVRLDPREARAATGERGGGVDGVHRALAATVARLGKVLAGAGVAHRVLDAAELTEALHTACTGDAEARADAAEGWHGWSAGGVRHLSFEVADWPAAAGPGLLEPIAAAAAEPVAVSLTFRARGAAPRVRAVVRLVAAADRADRAAAALVGEAARQGLRLRPLDGVHGPAVYASAPTGGWAS
jgi:type VII secretion protein EccE